MVVWAASGCFCSALAVGAEFAQNKTRGYLATFCGISSCARRPAALFLQAFLGLKDLANQVANNWQLFMASKQSPYL